MNLAGDTGWLDACTHTRSMTGYGINLGGEPRSQLRTGAGSVGRGGAGLHGRAVGNEHVAGSGPGPRLTSSSARTGSPVTDPAERNALVQRWVQRRSTPWSVAWHALEVFDYDLNGEFGPWAPPPPFTGHPHWRDLPSLPAAWSRSEMLGYIDYCRQQARNTLADMTDEKAATTAAAGSPLRRPAARLDHHGPRRAHDRARVADPAVHHRRRDRA